MITDAMDRAVFEPSTTSTRPELLISAVLHLMSHYTMKRDERENCIRLAAVIERHLKALATLTDLPPVLQATCMQLSEQWGKIVESAIQPAKPRFRLSVALRGG